MSIIVTKELYKYEDKKIKQFFAKSYRLLNCINVLLTVDLTMKKKNYFNPFMMESDIM